MKIETAAISKLARRAAAVAAGVAAAFAVALAAIVPAPAELFHGDPVPADPAQTEDANRRTESASGAPSRFGRARARIRRLFLARPSAVRGLALLPLWAVGKALLVLLTTLFSALSPVWQALLGVLLNALLLFGLFAGIYKLLFPNKRFRDFFTKRNIILLSCASVLLGAADAILRAYWEDYRPISIAVKLVLALVVLILLSRRIYGGRGPWSVTAASR